MSRTPTNLLLSVATVALATVGWCGCSLPGFSSSATAPTSPAAADWLNQAHAKPNLKETPEPAVEEKAEKEAKAEGLRISDTKGATVRGQSPTYSAPPARQAGSSFLASHPSASYPSASHPSAPSASPGVFDSAAGAVRNDGASSAGSGEQLEWSRPSGLLDEEIAAGQGAPGIDPYASGSAPYGSSAAAPGGPTVLAQNGFAPAPGATYPPGTTLPPEVLPSPDDTIWPGPPGPNYADIDAFVEEARTGRLIIGAGINSEAGVTGQVIVDERNFDIWAFPRSFNDFVDGRAFRGRGQGFRLEAIPGNNVQRYLVSLSDPYLFDTLVTSNLSAFYFERDYFDYDEQRVGGRLSLGYRLTQDLSFSVGSRIENIQIGDPRVAGVAELDEVIGSNDLYSGQASVTYDTRDIPFFPTEGQYLELSFEQVFGDFEYPRFEADYRRYFLLHERADGSGRHTLAAGARFGITGSDTPLYDNYFAGGFSTLRGFDFRGASPVVNTVTVGGEMRVLTSVEYFFPLTADDMIKGVLFCDAGTVEEKPGIEWDEFRVAPGFGFRLNVPALGAAPLAFDFAFPVAKADTDDTQIFSFYIGIGKL